MTWANVFYALVTGVVAGGAAVLAAWLTARENRKRLKLELQAVRERMREEARIQYQQWLRRESAQALRGLTQTLLTSSYISTTGDLENASVEEAMRLREVVSGEVGASYRVIEDDALAEEVADWLVAALRVLEARIVKAKTGQMGQISKENFVRFLSGRDLANKLRRSLVDGT